MADKPFPASALPALPINPSPAETKPTGGESGSAPRAIGQRSSGARDALSEMAERAQAISQEAGAKITAAMKDVISSATGIAGFAVESARDLVQYMVRRGQMTQDEADKLIRVAEEAQGRRGGKASAERSAHKSEPQKDTVKREAPKAPAGAAAKRASGPTASAKAEKKPEPKRGASAKKSAAKHSPAKKRR